ncbi:hypothetical protein [Streptomyces sp. NPDC101455]|uniref:hypothetical protein n=1 Tax=Streptomyces sp. NPDC101455 TaxID=3366142 RepID=UPI0037FF3837
MRQVEEDAADLEMAGEAATGEEAVVALRDGQVVADVVLMDLLLPGCSGIEATWAIVADAEHVAPRARPQGGHDRVVLGGPRDEEHSRCVGPDRPYDGLPGQWRTRRLCRGLGHRLERPRVCRERSERHPARSVVGQRVHGGSQGRYKLSNTSSWMPEITRRGSSTGAMESR